MKKKQWIYRIFFYTVGIIVLAMGITLNTKANLGASAIISLPYSIAQIWQLDFATMTFVIYVIIVGIEMAIKWKQKPWVDLLQIPFALVFSSFLKLFDWMINLTEAALWVRIANMIVGIILTAIGAAMTVNMKLVPNPADGLAQAVGEALHKGMGLGKNLIDVTSVALACIVGLLATGKIVGVGIGTVSAMIFVGRIIALFNHFFREKMAILSGTENKA